MIKLNNRDCTTAVKGTALGSCLILLGYISKVILFEKGLKLNPEDDNLDSDKVKELIQKGKILILPEHLSFEDGSEEDVEETLPNGVPQFVRYGIKRFTFSYSNGICFGNALASLSNKKWDVAFVDNDGKLIVEHTEGAIKGFGTSLVRKGALVLNNGSASTKDSLVVALDTNGSMAMNERIAVIYPKDSVDWLSLEGIHEVRMQVENTASNSLKIGLFDGCSQTPIAGLDDAKHWKFEGATGNVVKPSGVTYDNGVYTIAGVSAGTYKVSLYDTAKKSPVVIDAIGEFYKADEQVVTIS